MALNSDRMCQKGSKILGSLWFWTRTFANRDMSTFDLQTWRTSFLISDLHSNGGCFHALKCGSDPIIMWCELSGAWTFSLVCVCYTLGLHGQLSPSHSLLKLLFFWIRIQTFRHLLKLDKREDAIELTQNWGDQFKKLVISDSIFSCMNIIYVSK